MRPLASFGMIYYTIAVSVRLKNRNKKRPVKEFPPRELRHNLIADTLNYATGLS